MRNQFENDDFSYVELPSGQSDETYDEDDAIFDDEHYWDQESYRDRIGGWE